jgi:hypothetical protein
LRVSLKGPNPKVQTANAKKNCQGCNSLGFSCKPAAQFNQAMFSVSHQQTMCKTLKTRLIPRNPENPVNLPSQFSLRIRQTLQQFHYKPSENPRTISCVSYGQSIPCQYPRNPKKIQLIQRNQKNKRGAKSVPKPHLFLLGLRHTADEEIALRKKICRSSDIDLWRSVTLSRRLL